MKNIKLIEVPSEIGAGTRGASLGGAKDEVIAETSASQSLQVGEEVSLALVHAHIFDESGAVVSQRG